MPNYTGPAHVLIDGAEHPVHAQLSSQTDQVEVTPGTYIDGLQSWDGVITGLDDDAAWAVVDARSARLRVGSRIGDFLPGAGNLNGGPLHITGSGEAPFES